MSYDAYPMRPGQGRQQRQQRSYQLSVSPPIPIKAHFRN